MTDVASFEGCLSFVITCVTDVFYVKHVCKVAMFERVEWLWIPCVIMYGWYIFYISISRVLERSLMWEELRAKYIFVQCSVKK